MLLHTAWLLAVLWLLPAPLEISWPLACDFRAVAGRAHLGDRKPWSLLDHADHFRARRALVRRGPYRFVRHPNYLVVAGEILALPLAFHEIPVAIFFSLANAAILFWRIREEETGLVTRRELS